MIRFALLGLTLSLLAFAVQAEDRFADGWSVISGDGKVRTSDCIGSNKTMACTIDTVMACGAWSYRRLYDEAAARYYADDEEFSTACLNNWIPHYFNEYDGRASAREDLTLLYQWRAWTIAERDLDPRRQATDRFAPRAGDWVVELEGLSCALDQLVDWSQTEKAGAPWLSLPDCKRRWQHSLHLHHYGASASYPEYAIILRMTGDGWLVVSVISGPGDQGSTVESYWAPERWLIR